MTDLSMLGKRRHFAKWHVSGFNGEEFSGVISLHGDTEQDAELHLQDMIVNKSPVCNGYFDALTHIGITEVRRINFKLEHNQ